MVKRMELTPEQEADIQKIMAETECPFGFHCYESKFEDLTPVKAFSGTDVIACLSQPKSHCPKSFEFGSNTMLCECRLRRYVSLNLGR